MCKVFKICKECQVNKCCCNYHKNKHSKYGVLGKCKICVKKDSKIRNPTYYKKNKTEIKSKVKEYRNKNIDYIKSYEKVRYKKTKDKIKIYQNNRREHINKVDRIWRKNKYHNDLEFNIICRIRNRLSDYLKFKNIQKNNTTIETIGLSKQLFAKWIEWNIKLDNLENKIYHLDHIIPLASFKCKTFEDIINSKCNHWTNIRPMLKKDNEEKGDTLPSKKYLLSTDLRICIFKLIYSTKT